MSDQEDLLHVYQCSECGGVITSDDAAGPEGRLSIIREHMRSHAPTTRHTVVVTVGPEDVAAALDD